MQVKIGLGSNLIEGVDLDKALSRFGGNESSLLMILRSYHAETPLLLKALKNITRENLPQYAIIVHGIKGSSRGIYAEKAGLMAEELEHAAKAGNLAAVQAKNPLFLEVTENLISSVGALLKDVDNAKPKPSRESPDIALLEELRLGCLDFDIDRVDEAVAELDKYRYESQTELIDWIKEQAALMEFEKIATKLHNIMGGV